MSLPFRRLYPLWIVAYFVFCFFCRASAQQRHRLEPAFAAPNLQQLIQQSGFIFVGTVTRVNFSPSMPGGITVSSVTFRVEEAIRGVRRGQLLEVREWAGLWNSGERYRVGERVALFLYPRSKLGLTSPVGGALGRFDVTSRQEVFLRNAPVNATSPSLRSIDPGRPARRVNANQFVHAIRHELGE